MNEDVAYARNTESGCNTKEIAINHKGTRRVTRITNDKSLGETFQDAIP